MALQVAPLTTVTAKPADTAAVSSALGLPETVSPLIRAFGAAAWATGACKNERAAMTIAPTTGRSAT